MVDDLGEGIMGRSNRDKEEFKQKLFQYVRDEVNKQVVEMEKREADSKEKFAFVLRRIDDNKT